MAAVNIHGKESEQSKERRNRKADKLAGEGSTAGKMKEHRIKQRERMNEIMSPSRQANPPQYGPSGQSNDD